MWNFVLPLFLLVKGIAGEQECSGDPFELCPRPKLFGSIPKNADEYSKQCKEMPNYIQCLREFEISCGSVIFFNADEEYESMQDLYSELCEEGSVLNTILIENLQCLNETLGSSLCPVESRTLLNKLRTIDTPSESSEEHPMDIHCLKSLNEAACITSDLSKQCGSIVKETAYDVIRRSNFIGYSCPTEITKRLLNEPMAINMQMKYPDFFYNIMGKFTDEDLGSGSQYFTIEE